MTEQRDDFDRQLGDRLSASESRQASVPAPDPRTIRAQTSVAGPAVMVIAALAVVAVGVFAFRGLPTGDDRPSASSGASPSSQQRISAGGISFVLPPGWDYVLPPTEWAISLARTPRIYFSNQPMRGMDCPYVPPSTSTGACEPPIQELDSGGVLIYWWVTDTALHEMPNEPVSIGGLPAIRTSVTDGTCDGLGADGGEQISVQTATWELEVVTVCTRSATDTAMAEIEALLDSIRFIESPTAPPSPFATPTSAATAAPPSPTTELTWTVADRFAEDGNLTLVQNIVSTTAGLVATGVRYEGGLETFGPTPARMPLVWLSSDGVHWDPVLLDPSLQNADLGVVTVREDGSLLAMGHRATEMDEYNRVLTEEDAAWTSQDGRTWTEAASGLPGTPSLVAKGARGYLALIPGPPYYEEPGSSEDPDELWHSADGRAWELVRRYETLDPVSLDGGDEGFVVVAWAGEGQHVIDASADGRNWIRATEVPPGGWLDVMARGPDWIIVTDDNGDNRGVTWSSANGLDWQLLGRLGLGQLALADGEHCNEYIKNVASPKPWLLVSTEMQYPCSEGGFVVHGTQYLSLDGAGWTALPFKEGTAGQTRTGSTVSAAIAVNGSLVLGGEQDGAATFWIGVP